MKHEKIRNKKKEKEYIYIYIYIKEIILKQMMPKCVTLSILD